MYSSDWSNGIRYHIFDTRPDTEFKVELTNDLVRDLPVGCLLYISTHVRTTRRAASMNNCSFSGVVSSDPSTSCSGAS